MLVNLHVKNLALIEEADIDFNEGLNILTGETGAGKSIIIGSVNIALGQKASSDIIRKDAEFALVEAVFSVNDSDKNARLKELGIDMSDEQIIISRKIMPNKSITKINGETVTQSFVKEITSLLIDIHGQHEHQSLLYRANYIDILDKFVSDRTKPILAELDNKLKEYNRLVNELDAYNMDEEKRIREVAFLEFVIDEIDCANLQLGEDEECQSQYKRLANSRKILENVYYVDSNLGQNSNTPMSISHSIKAISDIVQYDETLKNLCSMLYDLESLYTDVSREISGYIEGFEFDEQEFEQLEERINLINNLKSKYGNTIEEIFAYKTDSENKLENYRNFEVNRDKLKKEAEILTSEITLLCEELTKIRKNAAKKLEESIITSLKDLNFNDVRFEISFSKLEKFTVKGLDSIEFLISTNPGEDVKPLEKVASGGELSRIMLALKTVLADKDGIECLIFDEIDTGISGRTAQKVAEKLSYIGKDRQVICITHLPQIAAMADSHFLIEKNVKSDKTITTINKLSSEEEIQELGRMLGGAQVTKATIDSAKEMKDLAKNTKYN